MIKSIRTLPVTDIVAYVNPEGSPEEDRLQNYDLFWQNDKKYNLG
jgi:hypothetical protein